MTRNDDDLQIIIEQVLMDEPSSVLCLKRLKLFEQTQKDTVTSLDE